MALWVPAEAWAPWYRESTMSRPRVMSCCSSRGWSAGHEQQCTRHMSLQCCGNAQAAAQTPGECRLQQKLGHFARQSLRIATPQRMLVERRTWCTK